MDVDVSADYFAEAWEALNKALSGSGYVLNDLYEPARDINDEQTLVAKFHRNMQTMLDA
jgi:hypothetical protein